MSASVNILLVDDKPANLVLLEQVLHQPDRQLFRASSGNDALRMMLKHEFALVLLDVAMPEMDGYETAQLIRSAERTKLVPIIFVTAGDRSEERTFRGYETGAVDFLYKPLNVHTLTCKVDVFVELYRKTRELETVNAALERTTSALRDKIVDLEHVNQTLSHDLRGPLRSVLRFTGALAEELEGRLSPDAEDFIGRIVRAGKRMEGMLDDLYRLLQLGADDTPRTEVDAAAVLDNVVDSLRGDLDAAHGTVTHDPMPAIHTNRALLAQILQNLIANAIKFHGDRPPAVHVAARGDAAAWRFAVRDTGIGIPAADQHRIFQLFERRDPSAPGTGVGLALCKRAVEKLGGTIWVESQPGADTTFYFTLPRSQLPDAS